MSPYRTQSDDTTPEAERLYFDYLRTLRPEQRAQRMWEANEWMRSRAMVGLRERFPAAGELELDLRYAGMKYGNDVVRKIWGWDPDGSTPPSESARGNT